MKKHSSFRKNTATILTLAMLIATIGGAGSADAEAKTKPSLTNKKLTMKAGKSATLAVKGVSSKTKVKWRITDTTVIKKVKATKLKLKIKALKAGKAKVKATVKKKTLTCSITVSAVEKKGLRFEDFAKKASELIQNHTVQSSSAIAAADPFYTGRLIAKGKASGIDFSKYAPQATLRSDDDIYLLQFETSEKAKAAFQQISNSQDVEWVEPDAHVGTDTIVDNEDATAARGSLSWGVSVIGADAYAAKTGSDELTVAVVDTGVSSHSFLSGRVLSTGIDYVDNDNNPADLNSHGTHVSGTIVDCTPGLNIKILPVRVLDANGNGYMSTIANGIRYAADHGAKVINLSLGGGHSSYVDSYIQYALNKGVTVVAAAGNNYSNTSSFCPAHIGSIIVVGAIDDDLDKADFSNYGNSVDVVAPGVDVVSCVPGGSYSSYSGTSMATPHISACAAMIMVNNPGVTPAQVESMLRGCARDLGATGWDM
ncbi:MAG: S8 family serine peptidase, partial [Eubacterium sp.]|nr:S8 family serine peptidase [Eubacterium sp.]